MTCASYLSRQENLSGWSIWITLYGQQLICDLRRKRSESAPAGIFTAQARADSARTLSVPCSAPAPACGRLKTRSQPKGKFSIRCGWNWCSGKPSAFIVQSHLVTLATVRAERADDSHRAVLRLLARYHSACIDRKAGLDGKPVGPICRLITLLTSYAHRPLLVVDRLQWSLSPQLAVS